jgi:hypothetical protein
MAKPPNGIGRRYVQYNIYKLPFKYFLFNL